MLSKLCPCLDIFCFFFFKQKTAYEMRISDWSSDVCSSDLPTEAESLCSTRHLRPFPHDQDRKRPAHAMILVGACPQASSFRAPQPALGWPREGLRNLTDVPAAGDVRA